MDSNMYYFLIVLVVLMYCRESLQHLNEFQAHAQGTRQQVLDHKTEKGYEIVLPYQADSHGQFVSHKLHPTRQRRGVSASTVFNSIYYKFSGYCEDFHLELAANEALLAPGFFIQHSRNGKFETQEFHKELDANCHYHGTSKSHANSSVAVSLCDGLTGFVRTSEDDYLIEPLPEHLNSHHNLSLKEGQKPHMLYRRSTVTNSHHRNGTQDWRFANSTKQHFCGRKKKYQPHIPEEPVIFEDEYPTLPMSTELRQKRAIEGKIHRNRFVETLVVVDKKMIRSHGEEKIMPYVLTILNMVTNLYKDVTLGNTINMVLVSLLLLHDDQPGLTIDHHADHSLNSFCQWQSTLTTPNGTQHDHAILLTGMDICSWKNEPCDTLGFAPIGGMCSKYRSCTINEDTGLGLAFTVAHESGHSFGMVHDGDGNECKKSSGYIMSPTLSGKNGRFHWSPCSQDYLADFLSSNRARCTENQPEAVTKYQFPSKLPGELYDADKQCQWQFGPKARLCSFNFGKSICHSIWCHRNERRCETKFLPAADGTPCGSERWCIQGNCINRNKEVAPPVDGHWSEYGEYSSCSRTCGGGVQHKHRLCSNPEPQNGGQYCEGASHIYRMCNIQSCGADEIDFRAKQCASYNSKPFRGSYYEWQPYVHTNKKEVCKLYCMAEGFDFYFPLNSKVHDGTRCSPDNLDICLNGICQKVGCDYVLGSNATLDACGICRGNNSTCEFVKGIYEEQHAENDYYTIVKIPSGARHIEISEVSTSTSYIAIRNQRFKYYLTGAWTVDWPGNFDFAGTTFEYRRPYNMPEYLKAPGPTDEDLILEILLQGVNPGIKYEYTIQRDDVKAVAPLHNYTWHLVETECSASCAGGFMSSKVFCKRDSVTDVDASFCDNTTRPATGTFSCNLWPCPARWQTYDWSECSRSCGTGRQKRRVKCMRHIKNGIDKSVKESFCTGSKPRRRRNCNMQDCPPRWRPKGWSECSVTCGMGRRSRLVSCSYLDRQGQYREIDESECSHLDRPQLSTTKPCHRGVCQSLATRKSPEWRATVWSDCSQTCGRGVKTRRVHCITNSRRSSSIHCNVRNKPNERQTCNFEPCPESLPPACVDNYNWCYLVPQHGMCGHNFYGPKCCHSCK